MPRELESHYRSHREKKNLYRQRERKMYKWSDQISTENLVNFYKKIICVYKIIRIILFFTRTEIMYCVLLEYWLWGRERERAVSECI